MEDRPINAGSDVVVAGMKRWVKEKEKEFRGHVFLFFYFYGTVR